jgi:histidine triad (HIT) family protein
MVGPVERCTADHDVTAERDMTDGVEESCDDGSMTAASPSTECIFCRIVAAAEPAHIVYESAATVAFLDRRPLFHGHTLVVTRRHMVTLGELPDELLDPFWRDVRHIARVMPDALGAQGTFVANNNVVSQSVAHLHVHVVPRTKGDGLRGFFWPRTTYADGEADAVASRLASALARETR